MVPHAPVGHVGIWDRGMSKQYLGDGCYADFDGFAVVLTTEDGIRATNTVYLEPEVLSALFRYVDELRRQAKRAESVEAT